MSAETKAILTNREVIEVNQDPLGVQGRKVRDDGMEEVWAKPLSRGATSVVFLNRGESSVRMQVRFSELGMVGPQPVRDLWDRRELGSFKEAFSTEVPPHGVAMVRVGKGRIAP
jgi:alpha-galactosidase